MKVKDKILLFFMLCAAILTYYSRGFYSEFGVSYSEAKEIWKELTEE